MRLGVIMLLAAALGCAGDNGTTGITDTQFVDAMAALREAALVAGPDTARFMELRAEVLETQGVTEAELRAYVDARAHDLMHMAEMWDSVGARLSTPVRDPVLEGVVDSMADVTGDSIARPDTAVAEHVRSPRLRGLR